MTRTREPRNGLRTEFRSREIQETIARIGWRGAVVANLGNPDRLWKALREIVETTEPYSDHLRREVWRLAGEHLARVSPSHESIRARVHQ